MYETKGFTNQKNWYAQHRDAWLQFSTKYLRYCQETCRIVDMPFEGD